MDVPLQGLHRVTTPNYQVPPGTLGSTPIGVPPINGLHLAATQRLGIFALNTSWSLTIMASSRLTFGAILQTVSTTANTVTATLDAANKSVGILTAFVDKASTEQRIRHIADKEVFIENLVQEKAEERAIANIKIEKFIAQSAEHRKHYQGAYEKFTELLRGPVDKSA